MQWKAATLEGLARAEDPGLNEVKEAAEAVPLRKRPPETEIIIVHKNMYKKEALFRGLPELPTLICFN